LKHETRQTITIAPIGTLKLAQDRHSMKIQQHIRTAQPEREPPDDTVHNTQPEHNQPSQASQPIINISNKNLNSLWYTSGFLTSTT